MRPNEEGDGNSGSIVGPPRWVKVFATIGLIILALLVVRLVLGHGGPGRHL